MTRLTGNPAQTALATRLLSTQFPGLIGRRSAAGGGSGHTTKRLPHSGITFGHTGHGRPADHALHRIRNQLHQNQQNDQNAYQTQAGLNGGMIHTAGPVVHELVPDPDHQEHHVQLHADRETVTEVAPGIIRREVQPGKPQHDNGCRRHKIHFNRDKKGIGGQQGVQDDHNPGHEDIGHQRDPTVIGIIDFSGNIQPALKNLGHLQVIGGSRCQPTQPHPAFNEFVDQKLGILDQVEPESGPDKCPHQCGGHLGQTGPVERQLHHRPAERQQRQQVQQLPGHHRQRPEPAVKRTGKIRLDVPDNIAHLPSQRRGRNDQQHQQQPGEQCFF